MTPPKLKALMDFLIEHIDVFTWSHKDMLGIDNTIIEYSHYVDPSKRKVKQKLRVVRKKNAIITQEVDKILATIFI